MTKNHHLSHSFRHYEVSNGTSTSSSSSNSTDVSSLSNATIVSNTTNATNATNATVAALASSDDDSTGSILHFLSNFFKDVGLIIGLVFGVIGLLLLIGLGVWFYLKWKQKKIIKDYTMNPESFLEPQKLSIGQKLKMRQWELSNDPKHQIPEFTSRTMSSKGDYLFIFDLV